MYEGKGAEPVAVVAAVTGGVVLPNTGGNRLVAGLAIASITVGAAIIVSTIVRFAVKKAHKA